MTFNELAAKHRIGLLKFLMWKTRGDLSLSEDLCQITFLRAYGAYKELDDLTAFSGWIKKIATNAFINHVQREKSFSSLDSISAKDVFHSDAESAVDTRMIHRQKREELMALVYALPAQQAKAMALRLFEDMSFKEIAEVMDVPFDTAKANYRHGMVKIEAIMVKRLSNAS